MRADGTSHFRAQILDDHPNGIVADFDLSMPDAAAIRIGSSRFVNAAIELNDGGWFRVSLSGWTETPHVYLLFGPMSNAGESAFKPQGEAIILRALQFENGEVASAYKATGEPSK
jgi:hypothetical protein